MVRAITGMDNIDYLHSLGITGQRTVFAHCVWATDAEIGLLSETGTAVSHCPSSNMKLGSGVARIGEMLSRNVKVSLGADGAPCNNRLDMFTEMRTAALLQKSRLGPEVMPAKQVLRMATFEGARALGLEREIGSIEEGKRADLMIINLSRLHNLPCNDLVSTTVYSALPSDVETVLVDGNILMRGHRLTTLKEDELRKKVIEQSLALHTRAGLGPAIS
jgi:5-methylthioadenosine/S-adenosylhomocysteine deaminase